MPTGQRQIEILLNGSTINNNGSPLTYTFQNTGSSSTSQPFRFGQVFPRGLMTSVTYSPGAGLSIISHGRAQLENLLWLNLLPGHGHGRHRHRLGEVRVRL